MAHLHRPSEEQIRIRLARIAADHRYERSVVRTAVVFLVLWPLAALALMAYGLHTTDPTLGLVSFHLGALVGNVGILGTVLWAWWRVQR